MDGTVFRPPPYAVSNGNILSFLGEWRQFLEKSLGIDETRLALWHFERIWQKQPLELQELGLTPETEKLLLEELCHLAKLFVWKTEYSRNQEIAIDNFLTRWHIVLWISQIAFKRLSSRLPSEVKFDLWGIDLESFDLMNQKILDISSHRRIRQLYEAFQRLNAGTTYFLFEFITNSKEKQLSNTELDSISDIVLIKECIKHSSKRNMGSAHYFKNISSIFQQNAAAEKVLPHEYFQLRDAYFFALCPQFDLPRNEINDSCKLKFKLKKVNKNGFLIHCEIQTIKDDITHHKLINYFLNIGLADEKCGTTFLSDKEKTYQNQIRSQSKNDFLKKYERLPDLQGELKKLSKHEINRIHDINYSGQGRLALCINYYLENPVLLLKSAHYSIFNNIFYHFGLLEQTLCDMPFIRQTFPAMVNGIFSLMETNKERNIQLLSGISFAFIQYLEIEQNGDHLSFLIHSLNKLRTDLEDSHSTKDSDFIDAINNHLIQAYSISWKDLSKEDVIEILKILSRLSHSSWNRRTNSSLFKVEKYLCDERQASEILDQLMYIPLGSNPAQLWKKEGCHFSKGRWIFDLYRRMFFNQDFNSIHDLLNAKIPGVDKNIPCKQPSCLKEITKGEYFCFDQTSGEYFNISKTIRIFEKEGRAILSEKFDGSWCDYQFSCPLNELMGNVNLRMENLLWYKKIHDQGVSFLGKQKNNGVVYEINNHNNRWKLIDRKNGLIFGGAIKHAQLPPPLNQVMLNAKSTEENIECWLDPSSHELSEVLIPHPALILVRTPDRRFKVKGLEGYWVADVLIKSPFHSLGPFLPLIDVRGKPAVLIPRCSESPFLSNINLTDPLKPKHNINAKEPSIHSATIEWDFLLYNVDENTQEFIPQDLESQIYLCYLYFIDQNWDKCFALLDMCKQTFPYSKKEMQQYRYFINIILNKKSKWLPNQSAFLLKIMLHHIEHRADDDSINSRLETADNRPKAAIIKAIVDNYVQFYQAIPPSFRLSDQEEQKLISLQEFASVDMTSMKEKIENSSRFKFMADRSLFPLRLKHMKNAADCKISSDTAINLNYQKILKEFSPFSLASVREKDKKGGDAPLSEQITLALWMGILSDNAQEFTETASKICFRRNRKLKKGESSKLHYKRLDFLRLVLRNCSAYKLYLQNQGLDYRNPKVVLENWSPFAESLDFEADHSISISYVPNMDHREREIPRQFAIIAPNVAKSILPLYPHEKKIEIKFLMEERVKMFDLFFEKSEAEEAASLDPLDLNEETEQLLDSLPIAKQLYSELISPKTVMTQTYQMHSTNKLGAALEACQSLLKKRKQLAQELAKQIKKEVNATPLDAGETLTLQELRNALSTKMNRLSHHQDWITLKDLAYLILENHWEVLELANPYLGPSDQQTLLDKTIDWMILETEVSRLEKVQRELLTVVKDSTLKTPTEINAALEQAMVLLSAERQFDPELYPYLLAFEYLTGIILRKSQWEKIEHLMSNEISHEIIQLMMGDGKTGVVGPHLAKMLANGERLSVFVVPRSLLHEYTKLLKAVSQNKLMQKVHVLEFSRSSLTDVEHLKKILLLLKNTAKEKGVLICTSETAKALLLKYEELLVLEDENLAAGAQDVSELTSRRQAFQEILLFLSTRGCALIDEGHLAMKSLQEMNFTLAKSDRPKNWEIEVIMKIYKALHQLNFDFSKPITTEADYNEWKNRLIEFLFPLETDNDTRNYLKGKDQGYYEKVLHSNPELAKKLALFQEELWVYLSFTLSRQHNRHYGRHPIDPEQHASIPFFGARAPSVSSLFGHKYVMFNHTVEMTLQEGLQMNQFMIWFKKQQRLWDEIATNSSPQEADLHFKSLFGRRSIREFDSENQTSMEELHRYFYKKPKVIFDYLETVLLPSIEIHTDKLTATEQELGNLIFNQVLLMSGTPYNAKGLPLPFQKDEPSTEQADFEEALFESKTTPATEIAENKLIAAIARLRNSRIEIAKEASAEAAFKAIREHETRTKKLGAFIDVGAFLKDIPARKVAQHILNMMPRVTGVVYFEDNSDQLLVLTRDSPNPKPYFPGTIPLKNIFAFFDHMHSFGADILLDATAEAIVTANQTCFFELKQGIKRMRQIEGLQTFSFLIPEDFAKQCVSQTVSGEINVSSLLLRTIINQGTLVSREIILGIFHELKHVPKKKFLQTQIRSAKNLGNTKKVLVENMDITPYGQSIGQVKSEDLFKNYMKRLMKAMPFIKVNWAQEVIPIIERASNLLAETIEGHAAAGLEQMQEVEKQQEQIKKVEIFNEETKEFEPNQEQTLAFIELLKNGPQIFTPLASLFVQEASYSFCNRLNDFVSLLNNNQEKLFDDSILITRNFAKTAAIEMPNWSRPIKPVDYFLRLQNSNGDSYFLIITLEEADLIISQLKSMRTNNGTGIYPWIPTLYNIQGQAMLINTPPADASLNSAIIQMKAFDEKQIHSREEEAKLLQWCRGREKPLLKLLERLHTNREKEGSYKYGAIAKTLLISDAAQMSLRLSSMNAAHLTNGQGIKRPGSGETSQPLKKIKLS